MKKLLLMIIVLLVSGTVMAQGSKGKMTPKSFLAFHLGPSFPTGDFKSIDANNEKAGYAKTGFNMNLNYGYKFTKNVGLTVGTYYNRYNIDKKDLSQILPGTNVDHWQFFGIAVGPMLTHEFSSKVTGDLRIMGGMTYANSPLFSYEGTVLVKDDWKLTPMFQGGLDLRFNAGRNVFLMANADYMYLQPEFKFETTTGELVDKRHQTISVMNLTGGVGIKF
jgi:hypothetical protein